MKASPLMVLALTSSLVAGVEKITYDDHIFPIFEQTCLNCHNPDKAKGGLDLSTYSGMLKGSSGGKIAEGGDGASSSLFKVITHTAEPVMPPEGEKLGKKQADLIRSWIDGGLLETASSKARKPSGPKIDLAMDVTLGKPEGPPPMPTRLSLEPVVVSARTAAVADMAASPWAPVLAVTGQKQVLLYHTDTLQLAGILPFPAGQPETLSFHPSGKYLTAGGGVAGKSGTTITWDITNGEEIMRNGREFDSVLAASLRHDLTSVALGGPSRLIKVWDTQNGEQSLSIKKHTDWVTGLAYSPDGILLATADRNGGAWVWEAGTGNEFHTLRGHQGGITALSWRADSNLLATASEDGQVIFWEMNNGKVAKKIEAHKAGVLSFDYARNGRFATAGRDHRVKIWEKDFNLRKELPAFSHLVVEVAFSHDGARLFTSDWNGLIEIWNTESGEKVGTLDSNPPSIATRITRLERSLAEAPAALAKARAALDSARAPQHKAEADLKQALARRDQLKKDLARTQSEREEVAQRWSETELSRNNLLEPRKTRQQKLQHARTTLNAHHKSLQKSKEDLAKAQGHSAELSGEEEMLLSDDKATPESLASVRERLAAARLEVQSATTRIGQLTSQLAQLKGTVHTCDQEWQAVAKSWDLNEQERKDLAGKKTALTAREKELSQNLAQAEKAIKPREEALAAERKKLAPAETVFKATEQELSALGPNLRQWQAAAVNHHHRESQRQLSTLTEAQGADLGTLTSKRETLATLPAAVDAGPVPEAKTLESEIAALETSIAARAKQIAALSSESEALATRYESLSATE